MKYFGHVGLALATSIAAWLNATLLIVYLKSLEFEFDTEGKINCLRILIASFIMIMVLYWFLPKIFFSLDSTFWFRFFCLFLLIVIGGLTYLVILFVSGMTKRKIKRLYGV